VQVKELTHRSTYRRTTARYRYFVFEMVAVECYVTSKGVIMNSEALVFRLGGRAAMNKLLSALTVTEIPQLGRPKCAPIKRTAAKSSSANYVLCISTSYTSSPGKICAENCSRFSNKKCLGERAALQHCVRRAYNSFIQLPKSSYRVYLRRKSAPPIHANGNRSRQN
jgi:hypothetical protein